MSAFWLWLAGMCGGVVLAQISCMREVLLAKSTESILVHGGGKVMVPSCLPAMEDEIASGAGVMDFFYVHGFLEWRFEV